jgi:hypothetical protein
MKTILADEFQCYLDVARLAVELARVQGQSGSEEYFLDQAVKLILHARDVMEQQKIEVVLP